MFWGWRKKTLFAFNYTLLVFRKQLLLLLLLLLEYALVKIIVQFWEKKLFFPRFLGGKSVKMSKWVYPFWPKILILRKIQMFSLNFLMIFPRVVSIFYCYIPNIYTGKNHKKISGNFFPKCSHFFLKMGK